MAITATDWTIDRSTGNIRYIGDDHGGASPSYATVIEFHRWLQGLADDAVASGDDELDITNENPSARSTDNIITLLGNYNIDDNASEHLYDGSIIQNGGDDREAEDNVFGYPLKVHDLLCAHGDHFWLVQVLHATGYHAGAGARGSRAEVVPLEKNGFQASHGTVPGSTCARGTTTNHNNIVLVFQEKHLQESKTKNGDKLNTD